MDLEREVKDLLKKTLEKAGELRQQEFVGEADEGRIRVTVGSGGSLRDVSIHPLAKRRNDNLTLGDLILEAINNAQKKSTEARDGLMSDIKIFNIPTKDIMDGTANVPERLREYGWMNRE